MIEIIPFLSHPSTATPFSSKIETNSVFPKYAAKQRGVMPLRKGPCCTAFASERKTCLSKGDVVSFLGARFALAVCLVYKIHTVKAYTKQELDNLLMGLGAQSNGLEVFWGDNQGIEGAVDGTNEGISLCHRCPVMSVCYNTGNYNKNKVTYSGCPFLRDSRRHSPSP